VAVVVVVEAGSPGEDSGRRCRHNLRTSIVLQETFQGGDSGPEENLGASVPMSCILPVEVILILEGIGHKSNPVGGSLDLTSHPETDHRWGPAVNNARTFRTLETGIDPVQGEQIFPDWGDFPAKEDASERGGQGREFRSATVPELLEERDPAWLEIVLLMAGQDSRECPAVKEAAATDSLVSVREEQEQAIQPAIQIPFPSAIRTWPISSIN